MAAAKLANEQPGQTLDATALVHEVWLRLAGTGVEWQGRTHFLRTAATAMRRILVDQARAKLAVKRGGDAVRVEFTEVAAPLPDAQMVTLDAALEKLASEKPDHAKLVDYDFSRG